MLHPSSKRRTWVRRLFVVCWNSPHFPDLSKRQTGWTKKLFKSVWHALVPKITILRHVLKPVIDSSWRLIMISKTSEKGQALILIALAAIGLFAFAALAIDGSRVYSDKRHAQNAADTAALAGALVYTRADADDIENDSEILTLVTGAAQPRATGNGYDGGAKNDITISTVAVTTDCRSKQGREITVKIVSYLDTTLARVIGRTQITNAVTATALACRPFHDIPFDKNAIVSLAPEGTGFDANGGPNVIVTGGGIYSNSTGDSHPDAAISCGGGAHFTAPSVTVVGGVDITGCSTLTDDPTPNITHTPLTYADYSDLFPDEPDCDDGAAYLSGGQWHPQPGTDGSTVALNGTMDFAPGLYCVTNSPGNAVDTLSGTGVTFFIDVAGFNMKLNGDGEGFNGLTAPTSGDYQGVLFYLAPEFDVDGNLIQTQQLDLRGNGNADVSGTVIAPSANVTMFGNSGTGAIDSQIIAYTVDTGGGADVTVAFNPDHGYKPNIEGNLSALR